MPSPSRLIALLDQCTPLEALDRLYQARYTGALTIHCLNGIPKVIEIPTPTRVTLKPPVDGNGSTAS